MEANEKRARILLSLARIRHRRRLHGDLLNGNLEARDLVENNRLQLSYGVDLLTRAGELADMEMRWQARGRGNLLVLGEEKYPAALLALGTPPMCLRWRGALPMTGCVAIVGSRAAGRLAMEDAFLISQILSRRGTHVISGGAYGVDAAAHRGALSVGAPTTVFLGSGLEVPYPDRHVPLFEEILDMGGGVVSQHHQYFKPFAGAFIQRNELMAAMATAVIVVAAERKSGALHTASYAKAFGRVLIAMPGTPGCEGLISNGAMPLYQADEVGFIETVSGGNFPARR